jgi:hypothetical protein
MAQAGFTPISLYYSTTAAAVPSSGNLVAGELALNTVDEKLYFKNSAGTVKLLASNATSAPVVSFSAGTTGFTPSTATTGAVTLAGTLATTNGGTGLTSFTANGVVYASSSSVLATGSALVFNGTNLGVGVTPSAWTSNRVAVQNSSAAFWTVPSNPDICFLSANVYDDGTAKYIGTGFASYYRQGSGAHSWHTAASGTAGNAITLTQAMTLDASGRLLVGTTSTTTSSSQSGEVYSAGAVGFLLTNTTAANYALSIKNEGTSGTRAFINFYEGTSGGTSRANISFDGSNNFVFTASNATIFTNGGSERGRFESTGTFVIKNDYQEQTFTANSSTAITLNIVTNGTDQVITLTGTATITMPTATAGKSFLLKLKTGAGGYTVTWSTVKWPGGTAPTLTSTASRMDIFSFFSDGTNWYGCTVGQNYTP